MPLNYPEQEAIALSANAELERESHKSLTHPTVDKLDQDIRIKGSAAKDSGTDPDAVKASNANYIQAINTTIAENEINPKFMDGKKNPHSKEHKA